MQKESPPIHLTLERFWRRRPMKSCCWGCLTWNWLCSRTFGCASTVATPTCSGPRARWQAKACHGHCWGRDAVCMGQGGRCCRCGLCALLSGTWRKISIKILIYFKEINFVIRLDFFRWPLMSSKFFLQVTIVKQESQVDFSLANSI